MKKQQIANETALFFRMFKISGIITVLIFSAFFFGVYEGFKTFNADLSEVYYRPPDDPKTMARDKDGSFLHPPSNASWRYGNEFNQKAYYFKSHAKLSYGVMVPNDIDDLKTKIIESIKYYQKEKLKISLIISLLAFIGIPILVSIFRITISGIKQGKTWVDENRTI
jgi:hypothetical protein